jgi:hydrogenase-4 component F
MLLAVPCLLGLLLLARLKWLNSSATVGYALFHLGASVWLFQHPQKFFSGYFATDRINILFLLILSVVFLGVAFANINFLTNPEIRRWRSTYYTLALLGFVAAMTAVILSTNLGLMWVFIEATTLASAYLIYFKGGRAALEAAWKYLFICSIGIALAFIGIIFLSMASPEPIPLSFDSLNAAAPHMNPFWLKLAFVFMIIGFGTKAGLAPVHAWLPDAHSEAPAPISALLSGALLNTAMLAIMKVDRIMDSAGFHAFASSYLLLMGFLSIFIAAVYIIRVGSYKRMLAYSSIENMGIIVIGVAVGGPALYAAILQAGAHSLAKASFFLTSGNILNRYHVHEIGPVTGLLQADNRTGWLWILSFVMLVGIPPSPIFLSEFIMVKTMLEQSMHLAVIMFMLLLTAVLFGMAGVVFKMAFGRPPEDLSQKKFNLLNYAPQMVFLTVLVLAGLCLPWLRN